MSERLNFRKLCVHLISRSLTEDGKIIQIECALQFLSGTVRRIKSFWHDNFCDVACWDVVLFSPTATLPSLSGFWHILVGNHFHISSILHTSRCMIIISLCTRNYYFWHRYSRMTMLSNTLCRLATSKMASFFDMRMVHCYDKYRKTDVNYAELFSKACNFSLQ